MPGYRTLPSRLSGSAAEHVRLAESHQQAGDLPSAMLLLEYALDQATNDAGVMPTWICGRLATVYRSLRRYEDEVRLLERYCESEVSEEASSRYRARLSKARAIAERRRKAETGALRTVREVRTRSRGRRRGSDPGEASASIVS
jgi:hypothetical protein